MMPSALARRSTNAPPTTGNRLIMPTLATTALRTAACVALLLTAGCALMGNGKSDANTIYAPEPRVQTDPSWPKVDWQLTVLNVSAPRMLDTLRIAVRPSANEVQVYKNANWSKTPSAMLEDSLLRVLEDSGRIAAVTRQGTGITTDYRLVLDLRRFESAYGNETGAPAATIEVHAKLLHARDLDVVETRTFLVSRPADGVRVPEVVVAFEQALAQVSSELVGWVLATGETHERIKH